MKKLYLTSLIAILMLPACELLGPQPFDKKPLDEKPYTALDTPEYENLIYTQQANDIAAQTESQLKDKYYRGSGKFVISKARPGNAGKTSETGTFSLNFEEAALGEVVKVILSDLLNVSYMMSPKVVGKVTLQTSKPLAKEELLPTLELLLQVNNAVLLRDGSIYRIEPATDAMTGVGSPRLAGKGKSLPSGYQLSVMPLQYIGVAEMQEILKPMVSPKAIVRVDATRNLLMVVGTGNELRTIRQTVDMFDVDYMRGMSFGIFPLHSVDAETMKKELEEVFNSAEGSPMEGVVRLTPIDRLNALLVVTPQQKYLDKIKRWIARLDKATTTAGGGVVVYRVQHIKAVDLAETLTEIFSSGKKKTKEGSVALGRKAVEIKSNKDKKPQRLVAASRKTVTSISDISDVKFIADEANNSIIIVATAQEYDAIRNVVKQLDVMPLQVLIDASIFEVRLTDATEYGISWRFNNSFDPGIGGSGNLGGLSDLLTDGAVAAATAASTGGFSYVFSAAADGVRAAVSAAADKGNINVLSSPSLMVLNNQEATITVGDQVPIRTSESVDTASGTGTGVSPIQTSSIEMRDTGVTLKVTPRVNASGVVIMDIEQKVDTVQPAGSGGSSIDSPTILQRSISSQVVIHSGETVILGGLISDQYTINKNGIPWLMDIPYLGSLFGTTTKEKLKQELVVLITPRVVQNRQDARLVTREYKQKLTGVFEDVEALKHAAEQREKEAQEAP